MIPARVSALAFAAALGFAAVAQAQPAPPPPPPPPGMAMHAWNRDGGGDPRAMHAMHAAARLKALHDALNIRPDQEGAFQAFAASMKPEPGPDGPGGPGADGMRDSSDMRRMTVPERLDQMARKLDERVARMREGLARHAAAVKALYAVLSPEQRHTLDALPILIGHPGMGPGMGPEHDGMEPGHGMGHPGEED